eukprot:4659341-Prymnesium_polylepis.1
MLSGGHELGRRRCRDQPQRSAAGAPQQQHHAVIRRGPQAPRDRLRLGQRLIPVAEDAAGRATVDAAVVARAGAYRHVGRHGLGAARARTAVYAN